MHYEELGMRLDVQEHLEIVKLDRDRQEAVLLPEGEDKNEWLAVNTVSYSPARHPPL